MEAAAFDFPSNVSRGSDMSESTADTRTGHHIYAPLPAGQVEHGRQVFTDEWVAASAGTGHFEAMDLLRRPVARATCASVLPGLDISARNDIGDLVLAWIDALAPVISSPRVLRRWSRARRSEERTRRDLTSALAAVLPGLGLRESPPIVATMLAAGVQVPIAAGAWLLVFLASGPDEEFDADHVVWETLRMAPPTWMTARVTTAQVELGGHDLPANEVVLVSPLLLGRQAELVPDEAADLASFCPDRWDREDLRPGAWLPFGAGAHACPGRTLGLGILRELATWSASRRLTLGSSVAVDQSRGILPSPAHILVSLRHEVDR